MATPVVALPEASGITFDARDGLLFASNRLRHDKFRLKGVSWFGAEGSSATPDGLWQRSAATFMDFLRAHGFNALRLPLAVDNVLTNPEVGKWSLTANAEYYGAPPPKASGVAYGEALQAAKDYKYAARPVAGNEGEAFKAAEKKRAEAKARIEAGGKAKEESAAETMARLGLKAAS